jgi:hypothetical protein
MTDCILHATRQLTDAITGVQEAPWGEMATIQLLCSLLLGKKLTPGPDPHILPVILPCTPTVSLDNDADLSQLNLNIWHIQN